MAKWSGNIGFAEKTVEHEPGIYDDAIIVKRYYGDIVRNVYKAQGSGGINDNINISNDFSIVADPYARQNFHSMRYLEFMGTKWKITNVEVQFPRLVLSIGDEWNGE